MHLQDDCQDVEEVIIACKHYHLHKQDVHEGSENPMLSKGRVEEQRKKDLY